MAPPFTTLFFLLSPCGMPGCGSLRVSAIWPRCCYSRGCMSPGARRRKVGARSLPGARASPTLKSPIRDRHLDSPTRPNLLFASAHPPSALLQWGGKRIVAHQADRGEGGLTEPSEDAIMPARASGLAGRAARQRPPRGCLFISLYDTINSALKKRRTRQAVGTMMWSIMRRGMPSGKSGKHTHTQTNTPGPSSAEAVDC